MYGLDVHKAIVDNIYENTNDYNHETFQLPNYVRELINDNRLGIKTGEGLFRKENSQVYDIKTKKYRDVKVYEMPYIDKVIENFKVGNYKEGIQIILKDNSKEAKICVRFLIDYIVYSLRISREVAEKISDCDIAMAEGFNWVPPLALLELIGKDNCRNIAMDIYQKDRKIIEEIFNDKIETKYPYEKFMKAKR